jgi:hypothetical protein
MQYTWVSAETGWEVEEVGSEAGTVMRLILANPTHNPGVNFSASPT